MNQGRPSLRVGSLMRRLRNPRSHVVARNPKLQRPRSSFGCFLDTFWVLAKFHSPIATWQCSVDTSFDQLRLWGDALGKIVAVQIWPHGHCYPKQILLLCPCLPAQVWHTIPIAVKACQNQCMHSFQIS